MWKLGAPQGTMLGTFFCFSICFTNTLNLMNFTDNRSNQDGTTLYSSSHKAKKATTKLDKNANNLAVRFPEKYMKWNVEKCHLVIFGDSKYRAVYRANIRLCMELSYNMEYSNMHPVSTQILPSPVCPFPLFPLPGFLCLFIYG